jgi:hypothetical protein
MFGRHATIYFAATFLVFVSCSSAPESEKLGRVASAISAGLNAQATTNTSGLRAETASTGIATYNATTHYFGSRFVTVFNTYDSNGFGWAFTSDHGDSWSQFTCTGGSTTCPYPTDPPTTGTPTNSYAHYRGDPGVTPTGWNNSVAATQLLCNVENLDYSDGAILTSTNGALSWKNAYRFSDSATGNIDQPTVTYDPTSPQKKALREV